MFVKYVLIFMVFFCICMTWVVVKGPTIWDRLLAFNLLSSKVIVIIVIISFLAQKSFMLDVAIVYSLLGFTGTILFARFIQQKNDKDKL